MSTVALDWDEMLVLPQPPTDGNSIDKRKSSKSSSAQKNMRGSKDSKIPAPTTLCVPPPAVTGGFSVGKPPAQSGGGGGGSSSSSSSNGGSTGGGGGGSPAKPSKRKPRPSRSKKAIAERKLAAARAAAAASTATATKVPKGSGSSNGTRGRRAPPARLARPPNGGDHKNKRGAGPSLSSASKARAKINTAAVSAQSTTSSSDGAVVVKKKRKCKKRDPCGASLPARQPAATSLLAEARLLSVSVSAL
eukprot:COSAG01_NODE_2209_length_8127_cov_2.479420_2_plen_248_part_00